MDIVIPIGIYCYFGLIRIEKLRSFLLINAKRNKRYIKYVKNLPKERTFAKRFSQDIFPPSVGFGCKGTIKCADVQIFEVKSEKCRI